MIKNNLPGTSTVEDVIRFNSEKLVEDLTKELEIALSRLQQKLHARMLEQIFIEERLYKNIEDKTSYNEVIAAVQGSLVPFSGELQQEISTDDIERLLEIRIKRISRYDIDKQAKEIKTIRKDIKTTEGYLKDVVSYTIDYIEALLAKYGDRFPRQTQLTEFSEVVARKVALLNLTLTYNRSTGFLGHGIKAENEERDISFSCSEYDRLLLIFSNGLYKVVPVNDKLFVGDELEYVAILKKDVVFNVIYRDGNENQAYVKRFTTPKFILEKEYRLFPAHKRSRILLLVTGEDKHARASLVPSRRAKTNVIEVDFNDYLLKGPSAKGKRISTRVVRRVVESTERVLKERSNMALPGMKPPQTQDTTNASASADPLLEREAKSVQEKQ